jgi:hypothetical protein
MAKPTLVGDEPRAPGPPAPPFQDPETTERMALETAHKNIYRLSQVDWLTLEEVKSLGELFRIVRAAKDMEMKEFEFLKKHGKGGKPTGNKAP